MGAGAGGKAGGASGAKEGWGWLLQWRNWDISEAEDEIWSARVVNGLGSAMLYIRLYIITGWWCGELGFEAAG